MLFCVLYLHLGNSLVQLTPRKVFYCLYCGSRVVIWKKSKVTGNLIIGRPHFQCRQTFRWATENGLDFLPNGRSTGNKVLFRIWTTAQWSKSIIRGWQNLFWFFWFFSIFSIFEQFFKNIQNRFFRFWLFIVPLKARYKIYFLTDITEIDGFMK